MNLIIKKTLAARLVPNNEQIRFPVTWYQAISSDSTVSLSSSASHTKPFVDRKDNRCLNAAAMRPALALLLGETRLVLSHIDWCPTIYRMSRLVGRERR
jgi:hypothetical protein